MSTYSDASLILPVAPYTKANKIYSLRPTDGSGDFTFARNSANATYKDENGLIKYADANVPRYTHLEVGGCPVLLQEAQKTQILQYSNEIPNYGGTITDNYATSPDGTVNAMRVVKTSASDQFINQAWLSGVLSGNTKYIFDKYVKYDGYDVDFRVEQNNANDWNKAWNALFTIDSNGITLGAANNCTSGFEDEGNGWYRVYVVIETGATPVLSSTSVLVRTIGASGISYLTWQLNLGIGDFLTSTIVSDNSAETRLKDESNNSVLDTANVMQGNNWTFVFEKSLTSDNLTLSSDDAVFLFKDTSVLKFSIERHRSNTLRVYNYLDGAYMTILGGTWSDEFQFAITYDNGLWKFYRDGVEIDDYTEVGAMSIDELNISCSSGMLLLKYFYSTNTTEITF